MLHLTADMVLSRTVGWFTGKSLGWLFALTSMVPWALNC